MAYRKDEELGNTSSYLNKNGDLLWLERNHDTVVSTAGKGGWNKQGIFML